MSYAYLLGIQLDLWIYVLNNIGLDKDMLENNLQLFLNLIKSWYVIEFRQNKTYVNTK